MIHVFLVFSGKLISSQNLSIDFQSVVRNSLVSGDWGNEEREGKNPFERLVGFDLEIRNEEFAFQVGIL